MPHWSTWIQLSDPAVIEILAPIGFDSFIIDMEHSSLSIEQAANLMRAIPRDCDTRPFVRVRDQQPLSIRLALDFGAQGVIVPMVNNVEQARAAAAAAKFPPDGVRGTSYCRMNGWGRNFSEYQADANHIPLLAMIETAEGLDNLEAIVDLPEIDGIMLGSYDLSASLGIPGQLSHEKIVEAERRIVELTRARDKQSGVLVFVPNEQAVQRVVNTGFTLISLGSDAMFMRECAERFLGFAKGL